MGAEVSTNSRTDANVRGVQFVENYDVSLICSICTDAYRSADNVWSTSCGHLYHFNCLEEWKARSLLCPECRQYCTEFHRVFLNFHSEEIKSDGDSTKYRALEKKLTTAENTIASLRSEAYKKDLNIKEFERDIKYLQFQNEHNEWELKQKDETISELRQKITTLHLQSSKESGKNANLQKKSFSNTSNHIGSNSASNSASTSKFSTAANIPVDTAIASNAITKWDASSELDKVSDSQSTTKTLEKNTFSLLCHAKMLKTYGYKCAYVNNGQVYAKLNKKSVPIRITSPSQVDKLIAKQKQKLIKEQQISAN